MSSATMQQQDAGGDLKRRHGDAHDLEDQLAGKGKQQHDARRHAARQPRGADALFRRVVGRHGQKRRHHGQRIHDHEQRTRRQQNVFGQVQGNQIKGGWEKLSCQIASGAAARMNSFFGKEADDIGQFPAVGGGFPFAVHVQKAHAPEIFTLHPVTDAFFRNLLFMPHLVFAAGPAPVNLLSTANFTILAGAAITTTGGGIINGDIGASPIAGSAIGIPCDQVNGTIYEVDASGPPCAVINPTLLSQAKNDLTTAMNDAAGRTPIPSGAYLNPNGGNLGGLNLAAGLYKISTTTLITGSDLTLTGGPNDVWIFQCAQDLQLGSGIHVILAGGAQADNIFWQVGTSAVLALIPPSAEPFWPARPSR
jgi:hypothetical protein